MTSDQLRRHVRKRNALQLSVGLLALAGTPFAWLFSFWLLRAMFAIILVRLLGDAGSDVAFWLAVLGMIFLVIEGLREGWQESSMRALADQRQIGFRFVRGIRLGVATYMISQVLYFAPQLTLAGIRAIRSLNRPGPFTIDLGAKIHADLAARREWVSLDEYPSGAPAAALLKELGLIWTKEDDISVQLRIPPATAQ